MALSSLDAAVIVLYLASLSLIAVFFYRRQTSRSEYFLGGRKMHWILIGGSVEITLVSAVTYLSTPGEMIRHGIAYFTSILVLVFAVPIVNRLLIPVIVGQSITSAYEYLEKRFGLGIRSMASLVFVIKTLTWMGIVIYATGFAFAEVTGWDLLSVIIVVGVFTTLYTTAGGLRTVVWTDNLQLLILSVGAVTVPIFVAFAIDSGPIGWWETFSQAGRTQIRLFSFDFTERLTIVGILISNFLWNICINGGDQMALQRYLSTPSVRDAQRAVWVSTISRVFVMGALVVCGLALFSFYYSRSDLGIQEFQSQIAARADKVLPNFIANELPAGFSGLLLASMLAAGMSSLSSGINSISGVVVSDLFERFQLLQKHLGSLWLDRSIALVAGVVGVATAVGIAIAMQRIDWNLLEMTARLNQIFMGPLAILFFSGSIFPRVGQASIGLAFAISTFVSLFICFGKEWFGLEKSISFIWTIPSSFLLGMLAAVALSYVFTPPARRRLKDLILRKDLHD